MAGQKILDLNDECEFNQATYTITTTIKLPLKHREGVYYLSVQHGLERYTKGIVFAN